MLFVEKLFLWFLFYSFCGWVYESILVSILERRPVNRGFLNGPLCPIYGAGAVGAVVVLGQVHNPLVVFLLSMVGASILEYVTSWVMEVLFHARWWDYSDYKFNLNGRICLLGAVVFGLGGVVIVRVIQPQVEYWTGLMPLPVVHWLSIVCLLLLIIDLTVTVAGIAHFDDSLAAFTDIVQGYAAKAGDHWQWGRDALRGRIHDWAESSQEMLSGLRDVAALMLNEQQRRMIESFPHLKSVNYERVLETIRELLRRD